MSKSMKEDKLDKRAAALRDNLRRRKAKAKTEKSEKAGNPDKKDS